MRRLLLAALLAAPAHAAAAPEAARPAPAATTPPALATEPGVCDGKPVIMVVRGLISDFPRLRAYGQALAAAGLYPRLGGYYLNAPRAIEVFEGEVPANESILMVRFPCLAHARAFWHSRAYQQEVKPKRLNPPAGSFTVSVYPEIELPAYMAGRVTPPAYTPPVPPGALPVPE
jgi:uncharacterized protein (DUF1330 family)